MRLNFRKLGPSGLRSGLRKKPFFVATILSLALRLMEHRGMVRNADAF